MPACYRKGKDTTHSHIGPSFNRCAACGRTICYECISRHLPSGHVICVECVRPFLTRQLYRIREQPWAEYYRRLKTSLIYAALGVTWLFSTIASLIYRFASFVTKPFRSDDYHQRYRGTQHVFDINWIDYRDKIRFAFIFIGVALVAAAIGFLYSEVRGIPRARVLVAFSGTCVFWGILAIYLQYFFEPALPRPVSQIVAYSASFFLAILFGSWLINLEMLDKILAFLGL
jgi:hypothetical protein